MARPGRIEAPFTDEQVAALNAHQADGRFHGFTCGSGDRSDAVHLTYARTHGVSDPGLLVARREGWVCPACGYTQDWAHAGMAAGPGATA